MIFHDDDVMHMNMIESLYNKIQESESYVAVASNAYIINLRKGKRRIFNKLKRDVCILTEHDMCVRYITNDILPFPSYMYRSCIAKKVSFEISEGGKYCDSTFIIKLFCFYFKRGFHQKCIFCFYALLPCIYIHSKI